MLEKKELITIVCDNCGINYDGYGEGRYTVYDDKFGAWDSLEGGEWIFERSDTGLYFCCKECNSEYIPPKSESKEIEKPSPNKQSKPYFSVPENCLCANCGTDLGSENCPR
jgi:hypothetical protein